MKIVPRRTGGMHRMLRALYIVNIQREFHPSRCKRVNNGDTGINHVSHLQD